MSEISSGVQKFWEVIQGSEEFTSKFESAETENDLVALAEEVGVDVSTEEIQKAATLLFESIAKADSQDGSDELTDDQLEAVAGGAAFGGVVAIKFGLTGVGMAVRHSRNSNRGGIARGSW